MKTYQVSLNGKQYGMLEKMLCWSRAAQLAMNQHINGYELFSDMLYEIGRMDGVHLKSYWKNLSKNWIY